MKVMNDIPNFINGGIDIDRLVGIFHCSPSGLNVVH
jgi:hypothetical protein